MAEGDRLIGNSAFLLVDWGAITGMSLLFWLIIGKTLPNEVYGIVATSLNIMVILSGVALLGLQTSVVKLISEFKRKNQIGKIKNLVRFTIKVGLSVSAAFSATLGGLSPILSPILNLPVDVIIMVAVGIFAFSVWGITTAVMYGLQSMKRILKTNFVGNLSKVLITLFAVLIGLSYFGPLAALIISVVVIALLRIDILLLGIKDVRSKASSSRLNYKSIFTYSLSAFVASMAIVGFANTPNIILNALTSPAVTSLFAISLTITSPIFSIPSVLNAALFPITSGLSAEKGGRVRQRMLINMVVKYTSFLTLPIIAILLTFSGTIILFFSSSEFLPALEILPTVGVAAFLFGLGGMLNMSIYAIRKPVVSRNITILTLVVFLALSIPLSISLSAFGMAVAYLASISIFCVASFVYLRKFLGFSIDWKSILKILVAVAVFSAIVFGIDRFLSHEVLKFVAVLLALVVYLLLLIPMKFYKKEDVKILEFLSKKSPVGKGVFHRLRIMLSRYV